MKKLIQTFTCLTILFSTASFAQVDSSFLRDIAVLSVVKPEATGCKYSNNEQVWMHVKNVGTQAVGTFTFNYSLNGQTPVSETISLFVPIFPGEEFAYPFSTNTDLSLGYIQHIQVWIDVFGDTNYVNDSAEVVLYSFTQHDPMQGAYYVGFENIPSDSSQFAWTFADGDSDQVVAAISNLNAHTGSQSVFISGWGDWAISPCLQLDASKAYSLEFYATQKFLAALPDIISVWLGSSNDPASMTTQLLPPTWIIDTFGNGTFNKYSLVIQVPVSGTYHVGIQHTLGHGVYVDDVTIAIDSVTSCFAPTHLQTNIINASTVILSWQAESTAISYLLRGRKVGDPSYVEIAVPSTSITVIGLQKSATYTWEVASVCSSDTIFSFKQHFNIADSLRCDPPVSILTTQITSNSALLVWSTVQKAEAYRILGRKLGTSKITTINVIAPSNSFLAKNLSPATTYEWTVQTICDTANGKISGINLVTAFTTLPSASTKVKLSKISVTPNPNSGIFEITGIMGVEDVSVSIFDATGKEVSSRFYPVVRNSILFNSQQFNAGIYFVQIKSSERTSTERVVIY